MTQRRILLGGQQLSVDNKTGAVLAQEVLAGDWTLLRTVTADDSVNPNDSPLEIEGKFVDLMFRATGGHWGSCVAEMIECNDVTGAEEGCVTKQGFKDGSSSVTIDTENTIIKGVLATGKVTVRISSLTTVTELEIYGREG